MHAYMLACLGIAFYLAGVGSFYSWYCFSRQASCPATSQHSCLCHAFPCRKSSISYCAMLGFTWALRFAPMSLGLCGKHFYPLSHLPTRPGFLRLTKV